MSTDSPSFEAITRAEALLRRHFPATPFVEARRLSGRLGISIGLKLDAFTPIRTFKLRGALTKMQGLEERDRPGGAITASAGNHGLAVARAARIYGRRALIVVPAGANPQKIEAIAAEGAELVQHGADYQSAFERSLQIAEERAWNHVHAYDDPEVIAGQGTLGVELPECDAFLCGIGGGGLIAGVSLALRARFDKAVRIVGVQPEGADSMVRSLEAGRPVAIERVSTIADGLGARRPGELTFELVRQHVDEVVRVSDDDLRKAMRILFEEERIIAEPAGVAGLAALLRYPDRVHGRVTVAITGANLSDQLFGELRRAI
jgi:threonine dehydratase